MSGDLCEYEKNRLENMRRNQDHLRLIGLADFELKPKQKKRKRDESQIPSLPRRIMPKRGKQIMNYDFSSHYDELDRCEEMKPIRARKRRQTEPISYYSNDDYVASSKRQKKCKDTMIDSVFETNESHNIRSSTLQHERDPLAGEQKKKLFLFRFTAQHLKDAIFPEGDIKSFQTYCDDFAHVRFSSLTKKYAVEDIISVAHASTRGDDLSAYDSCLVSDYCTEVTQFKGNDFQLAFHDSKTYSSVNPRVICRFCGIAFAMKDNGQIRQHGNCIQV